ncbi:hypothetical protein D6817_03635 [Candidatus Pacearchaeota archaeon]|nr:MAG: hypothetical protein D6817_03635 [Candidatus Pacearchaeota archaeon]
MKARRKVSRRARAKKVRQKRNSRWILIMILLLSLVLIALLFMLAAENGYINLQKFGEKRERTEFKILDECSIIAGKLIHTIADEGVCKVRCKERCELLELDMESFNFTRAELNCHTCSCVCS